MSASARVPLLAALPVEVQQHAFRPQSGAKLPDGLTAAGVSEKFSTTPLISLYGSSKLASEAVALESAETFNFPVWINRCGVLAGAGQFGKPDRGIFSFGINSHLRRRPLKYIGFDGGGHQVRDCLHPRDLVPVLLTQMKHRGNDQPLPVHLRPCLAGKIFQPGRLPEKITPPPAGSEQTPADDLAAKGLHFGLINTAPAKRRGFG